MPEINALCLRAARGAGLGWGMAEDCAHAATWLAARDFDWADTVLYQLETSGGRQFTPKVRRWDTVTPACALHVGVAFSDFATLPEGPGSDGVCVGQVSGPLMIVPFAARASAVLGTALEITLDGAPWLHLSGDNLRIQGIGLMETRIAEVSVTPAPLDPTPPTQAALQSATISRHHLSRLDELALKMTVPSSATSAKGAGADDD
ncbi:Protein of unknown function [Sulfitobacter marinus]|uniref:DUF3726 domain-containing protein n=1 Tax=Sulfitobacter marinus TaxID=394264 RepID=A0A1I6UL85_9RHOB|nr:DUF3726 domain-containing protein [Sulfitobacter marinus]SFT02168.1 Protein of unknown function [Sulfitobacter marinus]